MKKLLAFLLALSFLLTAGCSLSSDTSDDMANNTTATTTTTTTATTTTTPTFIEEERIIKIAEQHWGIRDGDRAPDTGFTMYLSFAEMPTADNPVYCVALRWMVEDKNGQPSHLSLIDSVRIDAITGKVIDSPKEK